MITCYGEALKPYLVQTLTDLGCVVHEGPVPKTAESKWETPEVGVEMTGDKYDGINWTTSTFRLTSTIECAHREHAVERANNVLGLVARRILRNVEFGLPRIAGKRPLWLPGSKVSGSRPTGEAIDSHNIKLVWECEFLTACGGI